MSGETVVALATPRGRGGIATILLAGPKAERILTFLFRTPSGQRVNKWSRNRLRFGVIVRKNKRIDEVIAGCVHDGLLGPECVEIHCHGGPAAAAALLDALTAKGAVLVETQRVLDDGDQLVVIQKEVLEALPAAGTERSADLLLAQFDGGLTEAARRWAKCPADSRDQIQAALTTWEAARLLTNPPRIVLAGPTNAGKSSLTNSLLARPVSIVHETPGTTRDYVTHLGEIAGFAMNVVDTAGLGFAESEIDRQATRFAHEQVEAAEIILAVFDASVAPTEADRELLNMWRHDPRCVLVANKIDLAAPPDWLTEAGDCVAVSAKTGDAIDALAERLTSRLGLDALAAGEPLCFTVRQRDLLDAALAGESPSAITQLLHGPIT